MIENAEPRIAGVVSFRCRMHTPVSNGSRRGPTGQAAVKSRPKISRILCRRSGERAPYLAGDGVILERISHLASRAACVLA